MVYDYCLGRETFADFHDCRCVAEQFLDHRAEIAAQAPWHQPEKNSLIGMADDVADRCPNKPGVASYGYNQCTREFGVRLQDGVDAFCNCYADRFADFYMQDPRSHFSNIGRMGSAALLACSEEISPNPLE